MLKDIVFIERSVTEQQNLNTVYFQDKIRKIDAIIVFKRDAFSLKLETFFGNLKKAGLHLEFALSFDNDNICFTKVHAPNDVIIKYAKLYDIPLRKDQTMKFDLPEVRCKFLETVLNSPRPDPNHPDSKRAWKTISKEQPTDITTCERNVVVFALMDNINFSDDDFDIGIKQLIGKKLVCDAFPLHDGPWEWPDDPNEPINDRQLLMKYWASMNTLLKQQPLFVVEKYYGYEVATYFAFIGFYNKMLVYASFMGVFTFFFGILFVHLHDMHYIHPYCATTPVKYHCAEEKTWEQMKFSDYCFNTYMTNYNSNLITFIYSWLMIVWCTVFKKMWKRKLFVLDTKWEKTETEDFILRPQFVGSAKYVRRHKFTEKPELYITLGEKILRYTWSIFCTVSMLALLILSNVIIVYFESFLKSKRLNRFLITTIVTTTAVVIISTFEKWIFECFIRKLTKIELPRTELEADKSYWVKLSIYVFINTYGRLLYVAFIKGRLRINVQSLSQTCLLPGCISEVIFMLSLMLLVKPLIDNYSEIQKPIAWNIYRKLRRGTKDLTNHPGWEKEYIANDLGNVLAEVEEMVVQYGLVACFAACFPLGPIIALMHNLMEIKVDSVKFIKYFKRPVSKKQTTSINLWFDIFETMTYVAIVVNAFFMAYTCNTSYMLYDFFIVDNKKSFFDYMYYHANGCFVASPMSSITTHQKHAFQAGFALVLIILGLVFSSIISYIIPDEPRSLREYIHIDEQKRNKK